MKQVREAGGSSLDGESDGAALLLARLSDRLLDDVRVEGREVILMVGGTVEHDHITINYKQYTTTKAKKNNKQQNQ